MGILLGVLTPLKVFNDAALAVGRFLAVLALATMVCFILAQVFFRYVMNDALPWPDEAARFMMLWMTGLIAPAAYRQGGFVAIDMFERALPSRIALGVSLGLMSVSLVVLVYLLRIGWSEVTGFAGSFKTASLYTFILPSWSNMNIEFGLAKMPRSHMMASLVFGLSLMIVVNIELVLRTFVHLMGGGDRLQPLNKTDMAGAE
ncbi:MAG: TRAP-type C4-dicarboxylate transport system permease small subunit [Paracoccaceae bacterium]|jgi:TRAP-type C4-dicarboxylate transport system permease small subunit